MSSERDILDNLADDLRNALVILGNTPKVIIFQVDRMQLAWNKLEKEIRRCPYAGKDGAKCKLVRKKQ